MSVTASSSVAGERLLAQADLLLGLARVFVLPTAASLDVLDDLAAAADDLTAAAAVREPAALAASLRAAAETARAAGLEAWSAEHARLFACGVLCPIHEGGFVRRDKGNILGDVAGFYLAFGVALREDGHERPDHLVAELEFVAALLVMLARAEAEGLTEPAEVTLAALRSFGADHLGEWLPGFALRLLATSALPVYAHLADALAHTWLSVAAAHGIEGVVVEETGRRLPVVGDDPGSPYECGMDQAGLT